MLEKYSYKIMIPAVCLLLASPIFPALAADNPELWYQQGMASAKQENYVAAIDSLKKALSMVPQNQDYRLALARVHSWNGDLANAQRLVDEVLAQQADNIEAQLLKARLFYYRQSFAEAVELLVAINSQHPENTEAASLLKQVQAAQSATEQAALQQNSLSTENSAKAANPQMSARKRFFLASGLEHSRFSRRSQSDWMQHFLQLGYRASDKFSSRLRYEQVERFNSKNEYAELEADYSFSDHLITQFTAGYSDNAIFIPQIRFKANSRLRLIYQHAHVGDTWLTFDLQYDRYSGNVESKSVKPGLSYAISGNVTLAAKHINIFDDANKHMRGWETRLDWQTPWQPLRLNAGLSEAPESEGGKTVVTKSHFLGATIDLSKDMTLYLSYAEDDRENSYLRKISAAALVYRF